MSTVTASIVTYRTDGAELRRCLESLWADGVGRVWVVDNSPVPHSRHAVEAFGAEHPGMRLVYHHRPDNPGYGASHNLAIFEASASEEGSDYHLVVNSDVWFAPGVIPAIAARMDADPRVGQVSPAIFSPDGEQQYVQRLLPTPIDVMGRRFLPHWLIARRDARYLLRDRDLGQEADIPFHQGSFMMLRMEAVLAVGGFDTRFFMYPEDIDLTRRIHERWQTLYFPGARVVHAHRAASYHSLRMTVVHCVNMARYFNKWGWLCDPRRREANRRCLSELPRLQD